MAGDNSEGGGPLTPGQGYSMGGDGGGRSMRGRGKGGRLGSKAVTRLVSTFNLDTAPIVIIFMLMLF